MQDPAPRRALLDSSELSEEIGVTRETLARWRSQGIGPSYIRLGKRHSGIRYQRASIERWLAAREHETAHARAHAS